MDNIVLPDEQWDEQRQEREAFDRFHQALAAFMDAADAIWWCGDGHGGYVFDALINAAYQRGFPVKGVICDQRHEECK